MIDTWYSNIALENERSRALVAAEQQFQISITAAKATYVPGVNDAAYAASVTAAHSTKATAIAAAHAAIGATRARVK